MAEEADAIIIGGGPVGMTLAIDLSQRGVSTILIEKKNAISVISKAVAINSRSMEHYRRLGLQESIEAVSYPPGKPYGLYIGTSVIGGKTVLKQAFSTMGEALQSMQGIQLPFYQSNATVVLPLFCPQSILEPVLKKHLEDHAGNIKMFWGWQASTLEQDEAGVTIKITGPSNTTSSTSQESSESQEKVCKAKYLIACDGGSSWGRKQLGVHTYGKYCLTRAVSVTFTSSELFSRMKEADRTGFGVLIAPRFTAILVTLSTDGRFALHIVLSSDASDDEFQNVVTNLSECITEVMGEDLPHTIVGVSSYYMHALISTKFRVGRCLLAGDSAHQWLPAGGLGMNTGLSDVNNLAWKLEAVLKGYGGAHLLDSYETERRVLADKSRRFALAFGQNGVVVSSLFARLRLLVIHNPITRFFLRAVASKLFLPQLATGTDLVLGFQYSNSGIVVHERDTAGNIKLTPSTDTDGMFIPSSLPGCRAPHVTLPDCASILDLFGKKFVLLIIGADETNLELLKLEMSERGVPFDTYSYPKLPELVSCYDRKYFLVRPDGIVAWRSDYQPSALESKRIVSTITGDIKPQRLPSQIGLPQHLLSRTEVFDVTLSTACAVLVDEFTSLSFQAKVGIGLGVFWLLRAFRSSPLKRFCQQFSRHHAVIQKAFGEADAVLQIDPRFTGTFGPKDVVVQVHAASVNPLDTRLRQGYRAPILAKQATANRQNFFPLVLGRDCSGEVVAVGDEVTKFLPGDQVFGFAHMASQGTHAQLVALGEDQVAFKPSNIDHREAASLPWVAAAAWTALVNCGGLTPDNTRGKKILVHGGTGGVGSFAIQLLKAWGAEVTTTCSTHNVELAHRLGADKVVDYTQGDFSTALHGYDFVLNTVIGYEKRSLKVLKLFGNATYVSIINPRLALVTKLGAFFGQLVFSWLYRYKVAVNRLLFGRSFYYSTIEPTSEVLEVVSRMVERGEVCPLIDAVYSMDEVAAAHKHVEDRHTRGKVILTFD